ncbi:putative cysteine-rich receptor-like protein kinase 35 [Eucalyptus grandis]|uniref:putative cysteine-rich receptor-like protein kinase 35 n=1 Tax=Eucalyptus grandis TaxID=71139 RepID=UPI00192E828C|nr:putative cysteine-rich receptor-like protein kinase 35 [Eucalyptus grandis]
MEELYRGAGNNGFDGHVKAQVRHRRTVLPNFQTMFALLQCSPDLNQTDCQSCLRECINDYQDCCRGKQGGPVQKPSCIFRWDLYRFFDSDPINLPLSPPPPTTVAQADPPAPPPANAQVTNGNISKSLRIVVAVVGSVALFVVAIVSVCCLIRRRRSNPLMVSTAKDEVKTAESLQFKISEIRAATNSFAEGNKLGEGGFGKVYRGRLPNGQEIAVKRLSQSSGQGLQEFKNEIVLVAKLQHRNLVRLLGFCFEEGEKLLVYELMPNKSLDYFVFDLEKSKQLDWPRRYNIISGIARGMLYLHEDSRLRIIHRDLKASNILLDNNMNPKISDFGMARIFGVDQTNANTRRIVGTYGYMSPEYAMHGQFSQKSDVYSFGVLLLEIICGKRNDYYYQSDGGEALASYAWKHWRDNVPWEILDPVLGESYSRSQVLRCIHIGFLCVQEDPANRPTMASIVLALSSQTLSLAVPRNLPFSSGWTEPPRNIIANDQGHDQNTSGSTPLSVNGVSITELSLDEAHEHLFMT